MDLSMPFLNGIDGVEKTKANFPEIKVIMQTVFRDEEMILLPFRQEHKAIFSRTPVLKILQTIDDVIKGGAYLSQYVALRVMHYFDHSKP